MNVTVEMYALFSGRLDSHGLDVRKGDDDSAGGMRVDAPVTPELYKQHLNGDIGLGIYPTWHEQLHSDDDPVLMTSWGCCDIDTGDWSEAYGLATALKAMGMKPHIERSRSKGWHVWIFPDAPVTAKAMRRALKVAYAAIELPAKEANPKQEHLRVGQVGNYVRLPYKGILKNNDPQRQCFMAGWDHDSDGVPLCVEDWLDTGVSHTDYKTIVEWAGRYHEPERAAIPDPRTFTDDQLQDLVGGLRGDLMLFVKNGPQHDRSGGLVALAFKLEKAGYSTTECYNVLLVAEEHWGGKYSARGPASRDKYLLDILERAYS